MHSVNKANFAILHWFGPRFEPRFTDLDKQLREIYCAGDPAQYAHCLIQPAGQIDLQAIVDEKDNIDRIVATLGLKEMTQGTLVRKLCTYDADPTRRAIFEYDRLVRSATRCATCATRSCSATCTAPRTASSRITSCARPSRRSAAKKELTGRTDLEIEISNQCARLVGNAIVFYNSAILSRLLTKYAASGNEKALALITSTSPVAWQHVHLNGRYAFRDGGAHRSAIHLGRCNCP
jgi:hypothetical protein